MRRYVYGRRRLSITADGASHYYAYDGIGSVVNLTSASGTAEWTYAYEPFGATRTETQEDNNAPINPMKFVGELSDPTGFYYLRARQYDPRNGRFDRPDPASTSAPDPYVSSYVYARNRPTVLIDPSGMTFEEINDGQQAARAVTEETRNLQSRRPHCSTFEDLFATNGGTRFLLRVTARCTVRSLLSGHYAIAVFLPNRFSSPLEIAHGRIRPHVVYQLRVKIFQSREFKCSTGLQLSAFGDIGGLHALGVYLPTLWALRATCP